MLFGRTLGVGADRLHPVEIVVVPIAVGVGSGDEDQSIDDFRMVDGEAKGNAPAQRIAHDVGLLVAERLDEFGDVGRHGLEAHGAAERAGAAVGLQVDADDLAVLRQGLDVGPEHLDRTEAAVEQDQRVAFAVGLVPDLDAVDVGETGFDGGWELWHLRGLLGTRGDRCGKAQCCRGDNGKYDVSGHS